MAETLDMTDFPKIFTTEIIDTETDIFWQENTVLPEGLSTAQTLIITQQYTTGSQEEIQLKKIMNACQLSEEDYNIIHLAADEKTAWHKLKEALHPQKVITFGIHPKKLGITALFRLNAPNHFDSATFIPTLSLTELEQQPQAKKDLWTNALKPLFVDNK